MKTFLSVVHQVRRRKGQDEHVYIGFLCRCADDQIERFRESAGGDGLTAGRDYEVLGDNTSSSLDAVKGALRAMSVETMVWQRERMGPGKFRWVKEEIAK